MRYALACATVAIVCLAAGGGPARGQGPPISSHPVPEGVAFNGSRTARVVDGGRRLELKVRCTNGEQSCSGRVTVLSRRKLRARSGAEPRVTTLARATFGPLAGGSVATVTLPVRSAARHHLRSHRRTDAHTRFTTRDGLEQRLFLPYTITVLNSAARR